MTLEAIAATCQRIGEQLEQIAAELDAQALIIRQIAREDRQHRLFCLLASFSEN